jgi:hypothetical protein
MTWLSTVNWSDKKQFFNLLSPQPQLKENLWMKINSVEHAMLELHELKREHLRTMLENWRDECDFIIKKFFAFFFQTIFLPSVIKEAIQHIATYAYRDYEV